MRKGRLFRVFLVACFTIPILYLLFNYSDSHRKINEVYHRNIASRLRGLEVPVVVSGKSSTFSHSSNQFVHF